jgi:hypothetical protein
MLMGIDATLGTTVLAWNCNPDGTKAPLPVPAPTGLNSFVSIYEITTDPRDSGGREYSISFAGNLIAVDQWYVNVTPPDCGDPNDPNDDLPGNAVYSPDPTPLRPFSSTLQIVVPSPAGTTVMMIFGLATLRGRRR